MARATATASITFGLVTVPVKAYVSASNEAIRFNLFTPAGNRAAQKWVDPVEGTEHVYDDLTRGYEFAKGQFVKFTKDELAKFEVDGGKTIDIKEFVPAAHIEFIQVEKTYYLGPDKGGDKGYTLLSETLKAMNMVAVAQWTNRGRQHLVVVRPYRTKLVMQILFYSDEIRDFSEITAAPLPISQAERDMAVKLVDAMSATTFDYAKYTDEYREKVQQAVQDKIQGKEVSVSAMAPSPTVVDLFEALKKSVAETKGKNKGKNKK